MVKFTCSGLVFIVAQLVLMAMVHAAPFAYFVDSGSLIIVDTATNTVAAPVPMGTNNYAAVVNPAGSRVYVSNFDSATVSVVDTATNTVIATIPVAAGPQGLAVSPAGSRVYVANFNAGAVSVIDAGTNTVVTPITITNAVDVAINSSGTTLYVAAGNNVVIVNTGTNAVVGTLTPAAPAAVFGTVALSPNDSLLYAWDDLNRRIAVFTLPSYTTSISIPGAFANDGMVFHPSGAPAYHSSGSDLSIIDPASNSVAGTVSLGGTGSGVNGADVTPNGAYVYTATNSGARAFNTATNAVTPIATGGVRAQGKFVGPAFVATSNSFSGLTATHTGTATSSLACAGASCFFSRAAWRPRPGVPGAPPVDPTIAGLNFLHGLFDFAVAGSAPGFTATLTLTFPQPLPPGTVYYKYGATAANPVDHWYSIPATIAGNTVTLSITDGGLGDDDLAANGAIVDLGGPAAPSPKDTIGLYDPASGNVFLRNTNTSGPADTVFSFGVGGAVPLIGDWNGDGIDTIGLYDSATGNIFLRNSNTSGPADIVFSFGVGGAVPLVGDWNGDGIDTIGIYDPATGNFFLKNTNASGAADVVFSFGAGGAGYVPLAGDWDGDGIDTIGLYDPATGNFFLKNTNAPGGADVVFSFGAGGAGYVPLVGDWNGDGIDTIGLYDPATGNFFLRNSNTSGPADIVFSFGVGGGAVPLRGDWDNVP